MERRKIMPEKQRQLWVVDDDESVWRALKCLLGTYGFKVDTFLSGEKYFEDIKDGQQGCLLLDIHMPGLDGWEVLKNILKTGIKRPVIVISADKNGGLEKKVLKAGAAGFFQKPVNDENLVALINKVY